MHRHCSNHSILRTKSASTSISHQKNISFRSIRARNATRKTNCSRENDFSPKHKILLRFYCAHGSIHTTCVCVHNRPRTFGEKLTHSRCRIPETEREKKKNQRTKDCQLLYLLLKAIHCIDSSRATIFLSHTFDYYFVVAIKSGKSLWCLQASHVL